MSSQTIIDDMRLQGKNLRSIVDSYSGIMDGPVSAGWFLAAGRETVVPQEEISVDKDVAEVLKSERGGHNVFLKVFDLMVKVFALTGSVQEAFNHGLLVIDRCGEVNPQHGLFNGYAGYARHFLEGFFGDDKPEIRLTMEGMTCHELLLAAQDRAIERYEANTKYWLEKASQARA